MTTRSLTTTRSITQTFGFWLHKNFALLQQGHELALPMNLPHPSAVGFREAQLADFGQLRDWTLDMERGRLVVHELRFGQCIIRFEKKQRVAARPLDALLDVAEVGLGMLAVGLVAVGALVVAEARD